MVEENHASLSRPDDWIGGRPSFGRSDRSQSCRIRSHLADNSWIKSSAGARPQSDRSQSVRSLVSPSCETPMSSTKQGTDEVPYRSPNPSSRKLLGHRNHWMGVTGEAYRASCATSSSQLSVGSAHSDTERTEDSMLSHGDPSSSSSPTRKWKRPERPKMWVYACGDDERVMDRPPEWLGARYS